MICVRCHKDAPDAPFCCWCGAPQERKRINHRRPNGTGTAYKRGRTWTARAVGVSYSEIQPDGTVRLIRRRPTKGGFRTKAEALKWASAFDGADASASPTLADLWNAYSVGDMTKLSRNRQTAARKAHQRLVPLMGRRIDTLTVLDLQTAVNDATDTHYTARDMKTLLSKLYQIAMAEQKATVNLSRFIVLPEVNETESEPFTPEELSTMWSAYENGNSFVAYVLLLCYSGMMPAELLACKKSMVDVERCEIFGCGRKTKKRKEVPIVFPCLPRLPPPACGGPALPRIAQRTRAR